MKNFVKKLIKKITLVVWPFISRARDDCTVRVLMFHDIPTHKHKHFEILLRKLSERWDFISPDEFEDYLKGNFLLNRNSLLITFDDGFHSNHHVATNILPKFGIKAIFFIVYKFLNITNSLEAREFISTNIYKKHRLDQIDNSWVNMTPDQVFDLIKLGHKIGAHTLTHARLSKVLSLEAKREEIIDCGRLLEIHFGIKVDHFAYTFGDFEAFDKASANFASERYPYIYSGLRGNVVDHTSKIIPRDPVEPDCDVIELNLILSGAFDFIYKNKLRVLNGYVQ